jgi:two-component system chemotaxis response regulator CheB
MANRSKVLIVDDSALMRQLLTQILGSDPELEVVGTAGDPFVAREKIKALNPDVLTLDIEMPRMDGLTFLEKLMRGHPMPVIMISSLTDKGADTTLRALSLGAIDYVSKPKVDVSNGTIEQAEEIVAKVKAAARAGCAAPASAAAPVPLTGKTYQFSATHKIVAIGASTGGTEALKELLSPLPADFPGIVIVQHMPETFTRQFAARLDSLCKIRVKEAQDGDRILPGHALLAPGGHHMAVSSQRHGICRSRVQRRTGESAICQVRGCLVFLLRTQHGEKRARRLADRHGRGWRKGHVGDEAGRRLQYCAG